MKLEDALPLMEAAFSAEAAFSFFPRGTSMLPMLRQGLDQVSIVSPDRRAPKVGEVILYRRKNGAFVLHRAVKKDNDNCFVCCGDNQWMLECGISEESIIGVLDGYYKDGKWISADDKKYRKYVVKRMKTRWFRHLKAIIREIVKG